MMDPEHLVVNRLWKCWGVQVLRLLGQYPVCQARVVSAVPSSEIPGL